MIINLIRESETALHCEASGLPAHRVAVGASDQFEQAEREVRRRALRSLADRESPPTAVVFVRTWEQSEPIEGLRAPPGFHVAAVVQINEHQTEPEVPVRVQVDAAQVESAPRRGRRART